LYVPRKKNRRKRVLGRALLALFAIGIVTVAGCGAYRRAKEWSVFAVRTVVVRGVREDLVTRVVDASGIKEGVGMLDLDVALVRRRVESLDFVERAGVGRRPPGKVVLRILTRKPFAIVNEQIVVGKDGREVLSMPAEPDLPRVICPIKRIGKERRGVDPAVLGEAVLLYNMAGNLNPKKVDASQSDDFRLIVEGGISIRLGSGGFAEKLKMVSFTLENLNRMGCRFSQLDARFASQVIVRR
jgi:cell division septal protein FtsQ